jgi:hypothetical protein
MNRVVEETEAELGVIDDNDEDDDDDDVIDDADDGADDYDDLARPSGKVQQLDSSSSNQKLPSFSIDDDDDDGIEDPPLPPLPNRSLKDSMTMEKEPLPSPYGSSHTK